MAMTTRKRLANPARLPFDLWSLEVFVSVCETGSMTTAAGLVGVTQAGVSQTVSDLEKRLATPLLDRSARPLKLTPAGMVLRDHANLLLTQAHAVFSEVNAVGAGHIPAITVGVVDSMERLAIPALSAFLPTVASSCSVLSGLTGHHVNGFLKREIDMIVGVATLDAVKGVERQEIIAEPYLIIMPPDRTLAPDAPLSEALRGLPMIRYSERSFTGVEVERLLQRLRIDMPRRLELDRPFGVTSAVAEGRGWAITTPLCLFEAGISSEHWRSARLPATIQRHLTLVSRIGGLARVGAQVADVLREALRTRFMPWIERHVPDVAGEISLKAPN